MHRLFAGLVFFNFIAFTSLSWIFGLAALAFAALWVYAMLKKRDVADALKGLLDAAWGRGLKIEASLSAKIHALENGGHLASGTSSALTSAQHNGPAGGTNGGQPPQTSSAAQSAQ